MKRLLFLFIIFAITTGCATKGVRVQDLNSWKGVPVEALDTHSKFLTIPMVRTKTSSGIEIRNYVNKRNTSSCIQSAYGSSNANINSSSSGYGSISTYGNRANINTSSRSRASIMGTSQYNAFTRCSSAVVGCDNIFYIKNGRVLEYAPTGQCYTDKTAQPEARYKRLMGH